MSTISYIFIFILFIVSIDIDNSLIAINVSYSDKIGEREIRPLLKFKKDFKKTKELIIITKDTKKKQQNIKFVPLWKWLLEGK